MLKNIKKSYDRKEPVIGSLSLELPENGIVCIMGPSGCGKTTLAGIIGGYIKKDSGEISGLSGKKISVIFQEDRLLPYFSLMDNLKAVCPDTQKIRAVLSTVGLTGQESKKPNDLSGGMRQRGAIARALVYGGDIFIMDEAFKGIDISLKESIMKYIRQNLAGKFCLFVTHNLDEAIAFSDEVYVFSGPPLKLEAKTDIKNMSCENAECIIRDSLFKI
ncbi:MAG: ATP-binding cassette domain-containing protein [Lachnospiraceae bacterium]|nr:ATP-binding cassette domain-containing protein [Lachnospiraceae bacterium]